MKMNKKGVSAFISWALIILLVVILSAMLFSWYLKRVQSSTDTLEEISNDELCNKVGVTIENLCQNTQSLYINITNIRDIAINQIVFGFTDIYSYPETKKKNITIDPAETASIDILKQGTLKEVEVTPVLFLEGKSFYCKNSKVHKTNIKQC
jgi:hypothetical protein